MARMQYIVTIMKFSINLVTLSRFLRHIDGTCSKANIFGKNYGTPTPAFDGMIWKSFRGHHHSLYEVILKVRPITFETDCKVTRHCFKLYLANLYLPVAGNVPLPDQADIDLFHNETIDRENGTIYR